MKYKLLKDLPWKKAGAICENKLDGEYFFEGSNVIVLKDCVVENNPEWFEPVPVSNIMDIFHAWPQGNKYAKWDRDVAFEFAKYYHEKMKAKE